MKNNSGKTFLNGIVWSVVDNFFRQAITLAVFIVLARILEPAIFGLLSFSLIFVNILVSIINEGVITSLVRKENPVAADYNTGFWLCLGSSIPAFLILFFTADFFEQITASTGLGTVMRATSFIILINGLSSVQEVRLRRQINFRSIAIRSIISVSLGGGIGVYMALEGYGVASVLAQQLITAVCNLVLLWASSSWRPGTTVSKESFKEIINFSKFISLTSLSNTANQNSDTFFVTYYLGSAATGIYTTGKRLSSTLNTVISAALFRVSVPVFSKLQNDDAGLAKTYLSSTTLTAMVTAPIFTGLAVLAEDITLLILGEKWIESVPIMQIVSIIGFLTSIGYYNQSVMVAKNKPQWQTRLTLLYAVTNVIAFTIFTRFGLVATALAFAGRAILLYPASVWCALKLTGVNWKKYIIALLPALVSSAIMAVVLVKVSAYMEDNLLIVRLITLIIAGIIIYSVLMYAFVPSSYKKYAREVIYAKIRRRQKAFS